jgi:hypothetical protein
MAVFVRSWVTLGTALAGKNWLVLDFITIFNSWHKNPFARGDWYVDII